MPSSARCAAGPIPERIRIAIGAGRQDDLPCADLLAIEQTDAGGATVFEQHDVDFRPAADRQVRACPHLVRQIRHAGVDAVLVDDVQRVRGDAVLFRPVEVAD
jgi:hypothetical protein